MPRNPICAKLAPVHSLERRASLLLIAALLTLAAVPARAVVAPPALSGAGVDSLHFSPNSDGFRESARYFFTLGGDSAQVVVRVFTDSAGAPSRLKRRLLVEYRDVGPDTLAWDGKDSLGVRQLDGRYWITATAENALGTAAAPPVEVFLDTAAPQDEITEPARGFVSALVHRVVGFAADRSGLALFTLRVSSRGGAIDTTLCEPCAGDTVRFTLDVPDPIAAEDSIRVEAALRDSAGIRGDRVHVFLVDSLPPAPPILDRVPAVIERPELALAGTAAGAESVFVDFDGRLAEVVHVLAGSRFEVTVRGMAQGPHTASAVAQDRALNRSGPSATLSFEYTEPLGAQLPERFLAGDYIQVNLTRPARSVTVKIYTLHGRLVRSFASADANLLHEFQWDLTDDDGRRVGSGPYVVRVIAEQESGAPLEKRLATVVTR
jgi:flagellar hook assembly protein FlgD